MCRDRLDERALADLPGAMNRDHARIREGFEDARSQVAVQDRHLRSSQIRKRASADLPRRPRQIRRIGVRYSAAVFSAEAAEAFFSRAARETFSARE